MHGSPLDYSSVHFKLYGHELGLEDRQVGSMIIWAKDILTSEAEILTGPCETLKRAQSPLLPYFHKSPDVKRLPLLDVDLESAGDPQHKESQEKYFARALDNAQKKTTGEEGIWTADATQLVPENDHTEEPAQIDRFQEALQIVDNLARTAHFDIFHGQTLDHIRNLHNLLRGHKENENNQVDIDEDAEFEYEADEYERWGPPDDPSETFW
ncbi:hypothetical protein FALBO_1890 [Fusarium albosuccineum]|uniref:Uncharacterized protein n=1 Tax=Fusarium albosuccineum TaxID=1237068 RepID=A0A8H4PHA1_9HYPO|nr:hypothetical protein FALBO_1890 [Fusarium albosuccineum]